MPRCRTKKSQKSAVAPGWNFWVNPQSADLTAVRSIVPSGSIVAGTSVLPNNSRRNQRWIEALIDANPQPEHPSYEAARGREW